MVAALEYQGEHTGARKQAAMVDAILLRPSMTPAKNVRMATSARANEGLNILLMRVALLKMLVMLGRRWRFGRIVFEEAAVYSPGKEIKVAGGWRP